MKGREERSEMVIEGGDYLAGTGDIREYSGLLVAGMNIDHISPQVSRISLYFREGSRAPPRALHMGPNRPSHAAIGSVPRWPGPTGDGSGYTILTC